MNLFSLCIDHKASLVLPDWWLLQLTSRSSDLQRQSQDLSIYGYLVGAAFLLSTIRAATFLNVLINSSMSLHNLMLSAVVKAPVLFFDTNPVGRVLNRFSRDINIMEELHARSISDGHADNSILHWSSYTSICVNPLDNTASIPAHGYLCFDWSILPQSIT